MLLMKQILGSTVKISRFSYILQQFIFRKNAFMIPHKTYITDKPAFVYLVCFHSQSILQSGHFHRIIFHPVLCLQCIYISVYNYLDSHRMCFFFSLFQNILQSDIFTAFFQHLLSFLKKWSQHYMNRHYTCWIILL